MRSVVTPLLALLPLLQLGRAQRIPYNVTGFGDQIDYGNSANTTLFYNEAVRTPNYTNAVSFQGFNWSLPITNTIGPGMGTNVSESWRLQLNYTELALDTDAGNATTGITTLSLHFTEPGSQWDLDSDWQLCTQILLSALPDNISNKRGNNSDGSCVPYLGQQCVDDYLREYRSARLPSLSGGSVSGCPSAPFFGNIDSCRSALGTSTGLGTGGAAVSNTTRPGLVYFQSNTSYYDPSTGESFPRDNVTRQGLSSNQAFGYRQSVFQGDASTINASSTAEARHLRIVSFYITPSPAFRNSTSGGYGWQPNVRLICGRADTSAASFLREASWAAWGVVALAALLSVA